MTIKEIEIQLALGTLSYDMKYKLACNKRASKKILTTLSTLSIDKHWYVRCRVADNPNTPKEVLKILSKDKDRNVRAWEVLTKLSTDKDNVVRYWVDRNLKFTNFTN